MAIVSGFNTPPCFESLFSYSKKSPTARQLCKYCMSNYVGRFAPSPSGRLHFGSLLCAVASYLDARANNGRWLLRIEDIDPPREEPGASLKIIECLDAHGLVADEPVTYQSKHGIYYREALSSLAQRGLSYRCSCIRKRVNSLPNGYDRHCLNTPPLPDVQTAVRINLCEAAASMALDHTFHEALQPLHILPPQNEDDFIIHRKDGLFAYQLAVVVDDIRQGITHIVRGSDLLPMTRNHVVLTQILKGAPARYAHIPVLVGEDGHKLSKQAHAQPVSNLSAPANLVKCFKALNLSPPSDLACGSVSEIIAWGIACWHIQNIPKQMTIPLSAIL